MQRYVDNPLIVSGKKFDLRLYIVIKGVDPIEAYVYEEGLARFCTVSFIILTLPVQLQKTRCSQPEEFVHASDELQFEQVERQI